MIETIRNAWKVPELRKKLLYVAFILVIFRLGNNIPVPFINTTALQAYFNAASTSILGLMNVMSGGSFGTATMLALSIQPYINASIIIQLLTVAIPPLERLQRGRRRSRKTEIGGHHPVQHLGAGLAPGLWLLYAHPDQRVPFRYLCLGGNRHHCHLHGWFRICHVAGRADHRAWASAMVFPLSLFAGIISRLPSAVFYMYEGAKNWAAGKESGGTDVVLHPAMIPVFLIGMILMLVFIVYISLSERKIPVQYAKRVVGSEDVRRSGHHHPHQGEYVRRHAHHLRPDHRVYPRNHRGLCAKHV